MPNYRSKVYLYGVYTEQPCNQTSNLIMIAAKKADRDRDNSYPDNESGLKSTNKKPKYQQYQQESFNQDDREREAHKNNQIYNSFSRSE